MKKIKKRLVCLLLCVCMCSSLFMLYANAIEPLDGPINADDNATLIRPTLEVSDVPQGAVAVGYNIESGKITYYRVNGGTLPNNYVEDITIDGYFPNNTALADGGISTDQYIGTDDRQVVTDTTQSPNSAIAYLIANGSNSGTAYMLSKNVAITAAHCVFKQSTNIQWL